MNFFEHQDRARRNAIYRVLLVTVIVLTPALFGVFLSTWFDEIHWYEPLLISAVILPFIAAGYWFQGRKLKKGGSAIAESFGGVLISAEPVAQDNRWLLDIVEEMAIASGSHVPLVYMMNQGCINALAAGRTPKDSVICVTFGATLMFNREEMQAVVAHLFSQIHNNDMRSDARMTGVYLGVAWFTLLLLPVAASGVIGASLFFLAGGWAYLTYFAMSRVNRERKFLADATAAQFTRHPQSVASALMKIGGHPPSSFLTCCKETENFLPMFFAAPFRKFSQRSISPHPPLAKRIARLYPEWDGEYPDVPPLETLMGDDEQAQENRRRWEVLGAVAIAARGLNSTQEDPAQRYQTQATQSMIPYEAWSVAGDPAGAQALIYSLLLCVQPALRARQLTLLQETLDPQVADFLPGLDAPVRGLDRYLRLSLLDLCVPALKQLPTDQYSVFTHTMMILVAVDSRGLFGGWALINILDAQVLPKPTIKRRSTLEQQEDNITLLLGILALTGQRSQAQIELAYYRACDVLPFYTAPMKTLKEGASLDALDKPLKGLQQLQPEDKAILMEAVAVCIENDGHITPEEIELARAIAAILDCPMPEGLQTPPIAEDETSPLPV
ncbi:M48 family metalloprotease [Pseudomonas orientalis]|uniref:M48 family metalloprotease n=1 Tax=Pseudomonas orientalis TaxID=76758 RepID=UPI0030D9BD11